MLQGRERPCPRAAGKAADRWCARDGGNGEQASRAASAPSRAGPVGKEDSQRRFLGRDAGRLGTPRQAGRRARSGQKQGAPAGPDDARKGRDEGSDKGISSACPGTGMKKGPAGGRRGLALAAWEGPAGDQPSCLALGLGVGLAPGLLSALGTICVVTAIVFGCNFN